MTALNLLMAAAENSAGRIVFAGSFEEPDEGDSVPCSPYAAAKWSASGYARMFPVPDPGALDTACSGTALQMK